MDQDRQIRFAIPPFFLLSSLLWGAFLGGRGPDLLALLKPETAKELFGLLAATAVLIVPVGFFISAFSITLLRLGARLRGWTTYEAHFIEDHTLTRFWKQIRHEDAENSRLILYAAATFDHAMLPQGIHTWMMRRWSMFNVCVHSTVAVILAHVVAMANYKHLHIGQTWSWAFSTVAAVTILVFNAVCAWRETMAMAEFQSHIPQRPNTSSADLNA